MFFFFFQIILYRQILWKWRKFCGIHDFYRFRHKTVHHESDKQNLSDSDSSNFCLRPRKNVSSWICSAPQWGVIWQEPSMCIFRHLINFSSDNLETKQSLFLEQVNRTPLSGSFSIFSPTSWRKSEFSFKVFVTVTFIANATVVVSSLAVFL